MKAGMTEFHPSVNLAAVNVAPIENTGPSNQRAYRLTSIDIVRGLVIVIMALDHVRDVHLTLALPGDSTVLSGRPDSSSFTLRDISNAVT